MKTYPSEVFLLQRIDEINIANHNRGATLEAILTGVDSKYTDYVDTFLKKLMNIGIIDTASGSDAIHYRLTGSSEGGSEEVKHYIEHRTVPD